MPDTYTICPKWAHIKWVCQSADKHGVVSKVLVRQWRDEQGAYNTGNIQGNVCICSNGWIHHTLCTQLSKRCCWPSQRLLQHQILPAAPIPWHNPSVLASDFDILILKASNHSQWLCCVTQVSKTPRSRAWQPVSLADYRYLQFDPFRERLGKNVWRIKFDFFAALQLIIYGECIFLKFGCYPDYRTNGPDIYPGVASWLAGNFMWLQIWVISLVLSFDE